MINIKTKDKYVLVMIDDDEVICQVQPRYLFRLYHFLKGYFSMKGE